MGVIIRSFIRKNRKTVLFYLLFLGIFYFVLYLYGARADALNYIAFLSFLVFLFLGTVDFLLYRRKAGELEAAFGGLPFEMKSMPASCDLTEKMYQDAVENLYREYIRLKTDTGVARTEMMEFYGLWAHQIKTPLAAMDLLLQSSDFSGSRTGEEMKMELFRTRQYVDMVLTYLRAEDMSSDLVLKRYPLDDLIRQAVRNYSKVFILKKLKLEYEPLNAEVLTDEKWLVFVFGQILSNALKYTDSGMIRIRGEAENPGAVLIGDTGIGIQPEDLPRVFEKGFTGYNGRQDKKATGIGLYLCRMICERLGHAISISSKPGEGTTVRLDLSRKEFRHE